MGKDTAWEPQLTMPIRHFMGNPAQRREAPRMQGGKQQGHETGAREGGRAAILMGRIAEARHETGACGRARVRGRCEGEPVAGQRERRKRKCARSG